MKTLNTITFTAACLVSANTFAADEPRIYGRGLDVDTRIYAVACPNGEMGSISVRYDIKESDVQPMNEDVRKARINPRPKVPNIVEVCAYPISDREQVCSARMALQKAAKEACK